MVISSLTTVFQIGADETSVFRVILKLQTIKVSVLGSLGKTKQKLTVEISEYARLTARRYAQFPINGTPVWILGDPAPEWRQQGSIALSRRDTAGKLLHEDAMVWFVEIDRGHKLAKTGVEGPMDHHQWVMAKGAVDALGGVTPRAQAEIMSRGLMSWVSMVLRNVFLADSAHKREEAAQAALEANRQAEAEYYAGVSAGAPPTQHYSQATMSTAHMAAYPPINGAAPRHQPHPSVDESAAATHSYSNSIESMTSFHSSMTSAGQADPSTNAMQYLSQIVTPPRAVFPYSEYASYVPSNRFAPTPIGSCDPFPPARQGSSIPQQVQQGPHQQNILRGARPRPGLTFGPSPNTAAASRPLPGPTFGPPPSLRAEAGRQGPTSDPRQANASNEVNGAIHTSIAAAIRSWPRMQEADAASDRASTTKGGHSPNEDRPVINGTSNGGNEEVFAPEPGGFGTTVQERVSASSAA